MSEERALSGDTPRLMRLASYASVSVACILIIAKFMAWWATGSVAVLSSLVDSLLDAGASIVNLLAIRHALTPADHEHRFGHGKAEALAAIAQGAFMAGSATFLLFEAGARLVEPRVLVQSQIGIYVMILAIVMTLALVGFQISVVRRTQSLAISADSLHYKGDVAINIAVIVALVGSSEFGITWLDPIFAAAIAMFIFYGAWQVIMSAYDQLMDRELPDETRQQIKDIALRHPKVRALHDLRTRSSGIMQFIQLHLELDGHLTLLEVHKICDQVEDKILQIFPDAEVIIHADPAGLESVPEHLLG